MQINQLLAQGFHTVGEDIPNVLKQNQAMNTQDQTNALRQRASDQQDQEYQQGQLDRQAKQTYAEASWALQAHSKVEALKSMPHVVDMLRKGGIDPSTLDEQKAKDLLSSARSSAASHLGMAPPVAGPKSFEQWDTKKDVYDVSSGTPVLIRGATPEAETFSGQPTAMVLNGQPVMAIRGSNGTVRPIDGASPYQAHSKTGQFDAGSAANTAEMIGKGQIPMLNGQALRTPWGQQVVSLLKQNYPDYNAAGYTSSASSLKGFTSGKESAAVRSLNVGIQHLDTLEGLSSALDNTNSPLFNKAANLWKQQTGQTAPNSFNSAKQIVSAEVVKAITGGGGGVADRQEAQHIVDAANSPQQLAEAIRTVRELFGGQLNGLQRTYEQGTGRRDFDRFLSPAAKRELSPYSDAAPQGAPEGQPTQTATDAKGNKIGLINGQWKPLGK